MARKLTSAGYTANKKNTLKEIVDLKKYSYCGILCETECELFKATKENNDELKKKVYEQWHMKEHFGFDFSPEKVFCYGCKPIDKPFKPGIKECAVRICAIDNGMESCIQCKNLASCDKEFWKKWKGLYKHVNELQQTYASQPGAVLLEIKK